MRPSFPLLLIMLLVCTAHHMVSGENAQSCTPEQQKTCKQYSCINPCCENNQCRCGCGILEGESK
uniref:U-scoloptoxin(14)-Er1a n=1 Tax=Ethmostigmus rubripes TaxID=62613 RepID=TXE1A_ETHRU|nr:RecName: Full=U-scoloptoxin(14)-Er1a; Short=U-SLPTX(14)-Er1a; Flags: Precursor [Ethmostigmus rubripes]